MPVSRRRFLATSSGLLAAPYVTRAQAAVSDNAIGQMLMLGFSGAASDAEGAQNLARHIGAGRVGGACFLGHNTKSQAGIESLTKLFGSAGTKFHPLIAIDQEGGAVQRLSGKLGYAAVPAAQAVAARNDPAAAQAIYRRMAEGLRKAGFNLNLAPVVDLGFEPKNPLVARYGRAFGEDGATVARYAGAFVAGHREAGVLTALKHFPGHGSTLVDSHARPVDLTPTWREDEIEPYRKLVQAGLVDIVMSGHLAHAKYTGGEPATLSRKAVETWLRGSIGYQGVVMTDDLDMAAIRSSYSLKDAIVRAVLAGNDMILLSNSATPDADLPVMAIAAIKEAVVAGQISAGQIERSSARLAMLRPARASFSSVASPESAANLA